MSPLYTSVCRLSYLSATHRKIIPVFQPHLWLPGSDCLLAGIKRQFLLFSSKGYLNLAQTIGLQEQSYCIQFGTFLGLFHQGDRIIKAILCLSVLFQAHEFLGFTPETFDQKCAQWLTTPPRAVMLQTVSALSQNNRLENYEVSNWGHRLIIISFTHIRSSLVMRQALRPQTGWMQLNLKTAEVWEGKWVNVRRVWAGGGKSWVRRKPCSGGPGLGLKRGGRGQECMGTDLGMCQKEWETEKDRKQTGCIFLAMPLKRGVSLSELQ